MPSMSTTRRADDQARWEQREYGHMTRVESIGDRVRVEFADGDAVEVPVRRLEPPASHGAFDWRTARVDGPEIVVDGGRRAHAVSWLDVRALTDSEFAAHLARVAEEEAQHVGQQIRRLRERRGLSGAELAARASITPQSLSRIERGRHDVVYTTLQRLLAAMNYTLH